MATYDEIARDVIEWSNRDTSVLPYTRIKQCIEFAHDEIYRTCRIASMEGRFDYDPLTQAQAELGSLAIPSNTVEFIQLRKKRGENQSGNNSGSVIYLYDVAEARNDIRSFYGDTNTKYSDFTYSRERNNLVVYPGLKEGEEWELYYYYRFDDPNIRTLITEENVANGLVEFIDDASLATLKETDDVTSFSTENADFVRFYAIFFDVPEWSDTLSYEMGNDVFFEDELYTANMNIPVEPSAGLFAWDLLGDYDVGDQVNFNHGTDLEPADVPYEAIVASDLPTDLSASPWNPLTTYALDDYLTFDSKLFQALSIVDAGEDLSFDTLAAFDPLATYPDEAYSVFGNRIYRANVEIPALVEFDVTATYAEGDTLKFSDVVYRTTEAVVPQAAWADTNAYSAGDFVEFNGALYRATADTAVGDDDPTVATDDWEVTSTFNPGVSSSYEVTTELNPDESSEWDLITSEDPDVKIVDWSDETEQFTPQMNASWMEIEKDTPRGDDRWDVKAFTATDDRNIVGVLEDNWFRDENEKALLFGALHQAFDYLDEQDQSQKFKAKFEQELQKLNNEEMMRQTRGGNIQTNFYNGLI